MAYWRLSDMSVEHWVDRVGLEYRELPGLSLTIAQAARLWNMPPQLCEAVFDLLVRRGRLVRTSAGAYADAAEQRPLTGLPAYVQRPMGLARALNS